MKSQREHNFEFVVLLTIVLLSHLSLTAYGSDEAHDSEETQAESTDSSRDPLPATNSNSKPLTQAERDKENSDAHKIVTDAIKSLEELKKAFEPLLLEAIKANDSKKIANIKAEYKEKYELIKKELELQTNQLEDREFPDGKNDIPLSESGKLVQEELVKAAKLQRKIETALKPMTKDEADKMEKARVAAAKDSINSTIGAFVGGMAGSVVGMSGLGAQAGASLGREAGRMANPQQAHANNESSAINTSNDNDTASEELQDPVRVEKNRKR